MPRPRPYAPRQVYGHLLALLAVFCSCSAAGAQKQKPIPAPTSAYNVALGTQAIGGSYQFTSAPMLVEAAHALQELGSNTIKFSLAPDKSDSLKLQSLTEIARDAASVKTVLKLPFSHYLLWVYPLSAEANRFQPKAG